MLVGYLLNCELMILSTRISVKTKSMKSFKQSATVFMFMNQGELDRHAETFLFQYRGT